ncbi:hypothetical protein CYMTET_54664 [Cymbomonas tetramitiformis]|uniref:Dynamin N-terminal domain-containing protein n=1 Tax=Cymbomonas tetramitiformis TaxID=36881 RepID=A0AAE0EQH5_9CHLO|nr:hypothetical protein CYMTET_54664 [Cymbomonas tetramitiformis]
MYRMVCVRIIIDRTINLLRLSDGATSEGAESENADLPLPSTTGRVAIHERGNSKNRKIAVVEVSSTGTGMEYSVSAVLRGRFIRLWRRGQDPVALGRLPGLQQQADIHFGDHLEAESFELLGDEICQKKSDYVYSLNEDSTALAPSNNASLSRPISVCKADLEQRESLDALGLSDGPSQCHKVNMTVVDSDEFVEPFQQWLHAPAHEVLGFLREFRSNSEGVLGPIQQFLCGEPGGLLGPKSASMTEECVEGLRRKWELVKDSLLSLTDEPVAQTRIGLLGGTGAGKSSMINCALEEEALLPTSGCRACTACVIELAYRDSSEYFAEVVFATEAQWRAELDDVVTALAEVADGSRPTAATCPALAKLECLFGSSAVREVLERPGPVTAAALAELKGPGTELLGKVVGLQCSDGAAFGAELARYVDSGSGGAEEGQLWPLVHVVRLKHAWRLLEHGAVLVDLPGVQDANSARGAAAFKYKEQCHVLWVVADITRAVDDGTAQDLLAEEFKRMTQAGAEAFAEVGFVCTKNDVLEAEELLRGFRHQSANLGEACRHAGVSLAAIDEVGRMIQEVTEQMQEEEDGEAEAEDLPERAQLERRRQQLVKRQRGQCARLRAAWCKLQMRSQFRAGSSSSGESAAAGGLAAPPDLPVYAISSQEMHKLEGRLGTEGPTEAFDNEAHTDIPQLRASVAGAAERHCCHLARTRLVGLTKLVCELVDAVATDNVAAARLAQGGNLAMNRALTALFHEVEGLPARTMRQLQQGKSRVGVGDLRDVESLISQNLQAVAAASAGWAQVLLAELAQLGAPHLAPPLQEGLCATLRGVTEACLRSLREGWVRKEPARDVGMEEAALAAPGGALPGDTAVSTSTTSSTTSSASLPAQHHDPQVEYVSCLMAATCRRLVCSAAQQAATISSGPLLDCQTTERRLRVDRLCELHGMLMLCDQFHTLQPAQSFGVSLDGGEAARCFHAVNNLKASAFLCALRTGTAGPQPQPSAPAPPSSGHSSLAQQPLAFLPAPTESAENSSDAASSQQLKRRATEAAGEAAFEGGDPTGHVDGKRQKTGDATEEVEAATVAALAKPSSRALTLLQLKQVHEAAKRGDLAIRHVTVVGGERLRLLVHFTDGVCLHVDAPWRRPRDGRKPCDAVTRFGCSRCRQAPQAAHGEGDEVCVHALGLPRALLEDQHLQEHLFEVVPADVTFLEAGSSNHSAVGTGPKADAVTTLTSAIEGARAGVYGDLDEALAMWEADPEPVRLRIEIGNWEPSCASTPRSYERTFSMHESVEALKAPFLEGRLRPGHLQVFTSDGERVKDHAHLGVARLYHAAIKEGAVFTLRLSYPRSPEEGRAGRPPASCEAGKQPGRPVAAAALGLEMRGGGLHGDSLEKAQSFHPDCSRRLPSALALPTPLAASVRVAAGGGDTGLPSLACHVQGKPASLFNPASLLLLSAATGETAERDVADGDGMAMRLETLSRSDAASAMLHFCLVHGHWRRHERTVQRALEVISAALPTAALPAGGAGGGSEWPALRTGSWGLDTLWGGPGAVHSLHYSPASLTGLDALHAALRYQLRRVAPPAKLTVCMPLVRHGNRVTARVVDEKETVQTDPQREDAGGGAAMRGAYLVTLGVDDVSTGQLSMKGRCIPAVHMADSPASQRTGCTACSGAVRLCEHQLAVLSALCRQPQTPGDRSSVVSVVDGDRLRWALAQLPTTLVKDDVARVAREEGCQVALQVLLLRLQQGAVGGEADVAGLGEEAAELETMMDTSLDMLDMDELRERARQASERQSWVDSQVDHECHCDCGEGRGACDYCDGEGCRRCGWEGCLDDDYYDDGECCQNCCEYADSKRPAFPAPPSFAAALTPSLISTAWTALSAGAAFGQSVMAWRGPWLGLVDEALKGLASMYEDALDEDLKKYAAPASASEEQQGFYMESLRLYMKAVVPPLYCGALQQGEGQVSSVAVDLVTAGNGAAGLVEAARAVVNKARGGAGVTATRLPPLTELVKILHAEFTNNQLHVKRDMRNMLSSLVEVGAKQLEAAGEHVACFKLRVEQTVLHMQDSNLPGDLFPALLRARGRLGGGAGWPGDVGPVAYAVEKLAQARSEYDKPNMHPQYRRSDLVARQLPQLEAFLLGLLEALRETRADGARREVDEGEVEQFESFVQETAVWLLRGQTPNGGCSREAVVVACKVLRQAAALSGARGLVGILRSLLLISQSENPNGVRNAELDRQVMQLLEELAVDDAGRGELTELLASPEVCSLPQRVKGRMAAVLRTAKRPEAAFHLLVGSPDTAAEALLRNPKLWQREWLALLETVRALKPEHLLRVLRILAEQLVYTTLTSDSIMALLEVLSQTVLAVYGKQTFATNDEAAEQQLREAAVTLSRKAQSDLGRFSQSQYFAAQLLHSRAGDCADLGKAAAGLAQMLETLREKWHGDALLDLWHGSALLAWQVEAACGSGGGNRKVCFCSLLASALASPSPQQRIQRVNGALEGIRGTLRVTSSPQGGPRELTSHTLVLDEDMLQQVIASRVVQSHAALARAMTQMRLDFVSAAKRNREWAVEWEAAKEAVVSAWNHRGCSTNHVHEKSVLNCARCKKAWRALNVTGGPLPLLQSAAHRLRIKPAFISFVKELTSHRSGWRSTRWLSYLIEHHFSPGALRAITDESRLQEDTDIVMYEVEKPPPELIVIEDDE